MSVSSRVYVMGNEAQWLHSLALLLFFLIVTESGGQPDSGKGPFGDIETNMFGSKVWAKSDLQSQLPNELSST